MIGPKAYMETYTEEQPVISEELWRVWDYKGKMREKAITRRKRTVAGIAMSLLVLGSAVYYVVAR